MKNFIYLSVQRSNSNTVWFNFQMYIYIYKAKRMVLQCNNGVGSNPVEGRTKI